MAFSGGVFSFTSNSFAPTPVTGTTISSSAAAATWSEIATGLSTCVLKDGTQTLTGNIPMAGFKLTGLGAGTAAGNSTRYEQLYTATTLTDAATISWDTSLAPVATVTLGASRTMGAPTNIKAGGTYVLIVTQDGSGGRTLTWNAVFIAQGSGTMPQPETAASAVTVFRFTSPDGTNLNLEAQTPFMDSNYFVRGTTDPTKKVRMEADGLTTATTRVITMPDKDMTLGTVIGTEQSASGTSISFTGIPSWAREIVVHLLGVSTNGTQNWQIQIGPSGGVETTGYNSGANANGTSARGTSGFLINNFGSANVVLHGQIKFTMESASTNTWTSLGILTRSDADGTVHSAGAKACASAIDRLRIIMDGTDEFDAGSFNISYSA